jgi:hypothetical protein
MLDKPRFDATIRNATPLDAVAFCVSEAARIYRESETIGGRKWAFSQLRRGWTANESLARTIPRKLSEVSRDAYSKEVATAVMRLANQVGTDALKSLAVCACLRLDEQDARAYKAEQADTIRKDQDTARNRREIIAVDLFVTIGEKLIDSRSYIDRMLGLCALTGRRTAEIGTSAVFEAKGSNLVLFTGQLKERTTTEKRVGSYEIPTLTDASRIVASMASVRKDKPELFGMHTEKFHNKCAKDMHTRAKVFAPVFADNSAKPKDLRSAWIKIVHLLFDDERTGKGLYYSRMLGHGDADLLTMQAYDDFIITDPDYI